MANSVTAAVDVIVVVVVAVVIVSWTRSQF